MINWSLFIFMIFLTPISAKAEQKFYYDSNGNSTGSSISAGNQTYYYGNQGQDLGSSMRSGNNTFYFDQNGNSVGSSMNVPSLND